tara:strand:- start:552 stop:1730 length:1179 start_codon:yes stop_codon:yes gene_type:complete
MSENTENVKKIRELEDFDTAVPISEKDYLIIATNEDADGDGNNERIPLTKKATIAQAVEVYNNSIAQPPAVDPNTGQPAEPDPEEQPGYEETDPGTGETVKRITTPVNGGNLDNFLDPDGGLTTVDFCQDANNAEVACDDPSVAYKTKKISSNGFAGYDAQFQYGFPKALKKYSGGILTEISYDIGKLLEHFAPLYGVKTIDTFRQATQADVTIGSATQVGQVVPAGTEEVTGSITPSWFQGLKANNSPNFGMILWIQSGSGTNFEEVGQGSYVYNPAWGFMYVNIGGLQLDTDIVQNFWMYDQQLGWVWVNMLEYPYLYVNADLFSTGSPTGWIYAKDSNSGRDLSANIYIYNHPDGAKWIAKSTLADVPVDPNITPPPLPTRAVTSIVPS